MSELTLEVQPREEKGKNSNRQLRATGMVPAVVYGGGREPLPIQVEKRTLLNLMRSTEGHNPVFLLQLAGTDKSRHAMIREMQIHPVSRQVLHVDFQRVLMTEKVRVAVHVEFSASPSASRRTPASSTSSPARCTSSARRTRSRPSSRSTSRAAHRPARRGQGPDAPRGRAPDRRARPRHRLREPQPQVEAAAPAEEALIETEAAQPEVIKRGKATEEE